MTRRQLAWAAAAAALLLAAAGLGMLRSRKPAEPAAAAKAEAVVELAASDVARAEPAELVQGLPLTGTLRAVDSAMVKARVAGELQGLSVREVAPEELFARSSLDLSKI